MIQSDLFEEIQEPSLFESKNKSPEYLWGKYQKYYEETHREYERKLAGMGRMKQENRIILPDLYRNVEEALKMQYYITAKADENPHQYCLRKQWKGEASFAEICEIIRNYGYVEWFWEKPYMMFNIDEFKYWSMGFDIEVTMLINRTMIKPCTKQDLLDY